MENDKIKLNPKAEPFKVEEQEVLYEKKNSLSSGNKFMDIHNKMNKQQQQIPYVNQNPYINPYYTDNPNDYYHPENLDEQPPSDYYQTMGKGYVFQQPPHPASSNYPQTNKIPKAQHPRSNTNANYQGESSYQFNNCYPTPYYLPGVMQTGPMQTDPYDPQQLARNYYGAVAIPTDPYAQQYYYQTQYIPNPPQFIPPPTQYLNPLQVNPLNSPPPSPSIITSDESKTIIRNREERDDEDSDDDHPPPVIQYQNIVKTSSADNTKDNANSKTNNNTSGNSYSNSSDDTCNNFTSANANYTNDISNEQSESSNIESNNESNNIESNNESSSIKSNNESSGNISSASSNDITSTSGKRAIEPMTPIPEEDEYLVQIDRINAQTTEKRISDIFSIVGNMKYVKIIENPKRYALVDYSTEKSAIKAIQRFNGTKINGDKILVYWCKVKPEKNKIILDNLPYNIEEEKIRNICSIVGDIESISIEHPINPNDRSRCEVIFKDKESIETAESILSDGEIDEIPYKLIIDTHDTIKLNIPSKSKDDRKPLSAPPMLPSANQNDLNPLKDADPVQSAPNPIYNSNPIYKTERPIIISNFDKEEVEAIFQHYGVKSIKEIYPLYYEVVLLENDMEYTAFKELNGIEYNHKNIILEWGKERREKRQLNTVFVGCLSEEVTEEDLKTEFSKVGELDSVKIFRQKVKGKSPDYAYVNYVDPKCIDKAIKQLNGFKIKGRYITVQYSRKKNTRS